MTREEEIREVAHFNATKFSTRNGYTTPEEACVQTALWADAHQPNPWISVEDRLPEKVKGKYYSKHVFVRYKGFGCRCCVDRYCYLSKTWAFQVDDVTHWMPIPSLTEGGEI